MPKAEASNYGSLLRPLARTEIKVLEKYKALANSEQFISIFFGCESSPISRNVRCQIVSQSANAIKLPVRPSKAASSFSSWFQSKSKNPPEKVWQLLMALCPVTVGSRASSSAGPRAARTLSSNTGTCSSSGCSSRATIRCSTSGIDIFQGTCR